MKPFQTFSFQLCFAYKGLLKDEVEVKFSYRDNEGQTRTETAKINVLFNKEPKSVNSSFKICAPTLIRVHCYLENKNIQCERMIDFTQMELQMHGSGGLPADTIHREQLQRKRD